jgi:hypothetical protein
MMLGRRKRGTQRCGHKDRLRIIAIFHATEFLHMGQSGDPLGNE